MVSKTAASYSVMTENKGGVFRGWLGGFQDTIKSQLRSRIPKLIQEVMIRQFSHADARIT